MVNNVLIHLFKKLNTPKLRLLSTLFWCVFSVSENIYAQEINLSYKIKQYQLHISQAMYYSSENQNDSANREILLANSFMPIHQWHKKELTYLLKRKFDERIFSILVRLEFLNRGFSSSYSDSSYLNKINKKSKKRIERNIDKWKLDYLKKRDYFLIKKIAEIESIDQFVRNIDVQEGFSCQDSCNSLKKKLIRYADSAYSKKQLINILNSNDLKVEKFGDSYLNFLVLIRHILNRNEKDSNIAIIYSNFCKSALTNFFITPDYYANLMDYCFNYYIDKDGKRRPTGTYGEYMNYNGTPYIDNPETIDIKREEIGLLPLYSKYKDTNYLPKNYIDLIKK